MRRVLEEAHIHKVEQIRDPRQRINLALSFLHKSHLSFPYMPYCIGCCQWVHFHCLCLLVKYTRKLKILTNYNTTKALSSIFNSSKGISIIFASEETFLNRHVGYAKVLLICKRATIGSFRIASHQAVIGDGRVVHSRECSVLVDVDVVIPSTGLGIVSCAGKGTI